MRAMRVALLSMRTFPVRALPVLSRSSARAPSRLVSTEAFVPATPLSKHIEQFMPTAAILTLLIAIASVSAYYNGELMSLKKEIEGSVSTLKSDMAGTASKLEERVAGSEKTLQERVAGIIKEVDAKNTGTEKAVQERVAGSEKTLQERVAGIEKAADLKVRSRSAPDLRARSNPLAHPPTPPPLQYKTK